MQATARNVCPELSFFSVSSWARKLPSGQPVDIVGRSFHRRPHIKAEILGALAVTTSCAIFIVMELEILAMAMRVLQDLSCAGIHIWDAVGWVAKPISVEAVSATLCQYMSVQSIELVSRAWLAGPRIDAEILRALAVAGGLIVEEILLALRRHRGSVSAGGHVRDAIGGVAKPVSFLTPGVSLL